MAVSIRTFHKADIEFALAQTTREGWDPTGEFFQLCLAHDPHGGFIAEADDRRVGMVTTTRHGCTGWIGNLIVVPERRRRGIGRRLVAHAMEHLASQSIATIRLEADPPGIRLYRRLGFTDEFESLRFRLDTRTQAFDQRTERFTRADLPAIAAFDHEHFGDDRGRLLKLLLAQAKAAYALRDHRQIRGYAFVVASRLGTRIGPWVARDAEAAETLLQSILTDWPDTAIALGTPSPNHAAVALLESHGFARVPSSYRMVYGRQSAGHPEKIFAIGNGAMG